MIQNYETRKVWSSTGGGYPCSSSGDENETALLLKSLVVVYNMERSRLTRRELTEKDLNDGSNVDEKLKPHFAAFANMAIIRINCSMDAQVFGFWYLV